MKYEVPIYEKSNLTLEEAAAYFNIGINKIREISDSDKCTLIKRKLFEEYLSKMYSI